MHLRRHQLRLGRRLSYHVRQLLLPDLILRCLDRVIVQNLLVHLHMHQGTIQGTTQEVTTMIDLGADRDHRCFLPRMTRNHLRHRHLLLHQAIRS